MKNVVEKNRVYRKHPHYFDGTRSSFGYQNLGFDFAAFRNEKIGLSSGCLTRRIRCNCRAVRTCQRRAARIYRAVGTRGGGGGVDGIFIETHDNPAKAM